MSWSVALNRRRQRFAIRPHINHGTERAPSFFPRLPDSNEGWFVGEEKLEEVARLEETLSVALPQMLELMASE